MDIKLNTKIILEKEFKTGMRGYNQEQVDLFLDDVIKDYQTYQKKIEELEEEIQRLQVEVNSKRYTEKPKPVTQLSKGATNFDILQRISNLERHVFGDKLSE